MVIIGEKCPCATSQEYSVCGYSNRKRKEEVIAVNNLIEWKYNLAAAWNNDT